MILGNNYKQPGVPFPEQKVLRRGLRPHRKCTTDRHSMSTLVQNWSFGTANRHSTLPIQWRHSSCPRQACQSKGRCQKADVHGHSPSQEVYWPRPPISSRRLELGGDPALMPTLPPKSFHRHFSARTLGSFPTPFLPLSKLDFSPYLPNTEPQSWIKDCLFHPVRAYVSAIDTSNLGAESVLHGLALAPGQGVGEKDPTVEPEVGTLRSSEQTRVSSYDFPFSNSQ